MKLKKGILNWRGLSLLVVLFLGLQLLLGMTLRSARVDLTENGLYTLTQGSKNIVRNLTEPVTLRFYASEDLLEGIPFLSAYSTRVRELLEEYVAASDGNLRLAVIDPEPFSEEEDEAVQAGLQGVPANAAGDLLYFGLVATNSTDGVEQIPFFDNRREEFLEYDISRMVYQLSDPAKPVVGLLSPLPIEGGPPPMFPGAPPPEEGWFFVEQMRELFEVRSVATDATELPADLDLLVTVHPKGLSDELLYAIDQFVLGGGKAVVFVDPHCEADVPPSDPRNPLSGMGTPRSSDLGPLLAAWGVGYDPEVVLGDRGAALTATTRSERGVERVTYVAWQGYAGAEHLDPEDPVTADLGRLNIIVPGILRPLDGAGTTFTPLITSTEETMEIEAEKLRFFPDPKGLMRDFAPSGERRVVAARVDGPASTAYPGGPPAAGDEGDGEDDDGADDGPPAGHLEQSTGPIHVLVVADADLLSDQWWVRFVNLLGRRLPMVDADNGSFAINALDSLSGSSDLISVRSRGRFERPFHKLEELRLEAEQKYLAKEQEFQSALQETTRKINDLQSQREETSSVILTPEQLREIEVLRDEQVRYRKELRAVKHDLGKDIESLQSRLKFLNVLGVPLLMAAVGLGAWFRRRR